jgi:hypothetical protein
VASYLAALEAAADTGIELRFVEWGWVVKLNTQIDILRGEVDAQAAYDDVRDLTFGLKFKAWWLSWKQWLRTHETAYERTSARAYLEFVRFEREFNDYRQQWISWLGKQSKTTPHKTDRKKSLGLGLDTKIVVGAVLAVVLVAKVLS